MAMQAVCASVIFAFLCVSSAYVIRAQALKTTMQTLKTKAPQRLLKDMTCGRSSILSNKGRIVGGEEATPHSWPWQVFIECQHVDGIESPVSRFCGGSIISDLWIVTAAHCVIHIKIDIRDSCKVFMGKHSRQSNESTELVARIADYFVHAKYNPVKEYNGNDLALYKLAERIQFTDAIKPICLPFGLPELPSNKTCYATGWGRTIYDTASSSDRLRQVSMNIQEERFCGYYEHAVGLTICAGQWDRGKGACRGDSGGPLACQAKSGRWYLRGVISQGTPKCNSLAVFTKIAAFEGWIKNITERY